MSTTATTTTTPPAARVPQAEPCRACGETGGYIWPDCQQPARMRGYCGRCYWRLQQRGDLGPLYDSETEMLWHTTAKVRQTHAVYPGLDRAHVAAATAACEREAARWLLDHPDQARPDLAGDVFLFGGEERAA